MKINLKHIHRIKKKVKGGYKYYYYHRFTRARLPDDPNSIEFMAALEEQSRFGRAKEGTLGNLMTEYRASPEFTKKAHNTRKTYAAQMQRLRPLENLPIAALTRAHCKKIQAKYADKPATANLLIKFLNVLMKFAVEMEYRKDNPAQGIKKYKNKSEYRPWTSEEYAKFIVGASKAVTIAVTIGLYTGQRISDCLKMKWSDFDGEGIFVKQQKTGIELHIECHPKLLIALEDIQESDRGEYIISRTSTKPYSHSSFSQMFVSQRTKTGLPKDIYFHGLRKTASVALAEAGCTDREIMAITGHASTDMVSLYVKKASQKKQAKQAMQKLVKGEIL